MASKQDMSDVTETKDDDHDNNNVGTKNNNNNNDNNATEEALCRYCFCGDEDGDKLISPCNCKGGQKWVHLECLRRWQRSVIVSQPTHPAFYERDERQFICNVCKSEFSVPPPSRAEMMASFTGDELASLLATGCFIVATKETSEEMAETLRNNFHIRQIRSLAHWIEAVMLVVDVEKENSSVGDDTIIAINLTRQIEDVEDFPEDLKEKSKTVPGVKLKHFIGGPCYQTKCFAMCALHATHPDEINNIKSVRVVGNQGGMWVGSTNVKEVAKIAKSDHERLYDSMDNPPCYVNVYWGDARWSRTQLLGELARGSWGMCRADLKDIFVQATEYASVSSTTTTANDNNNLKSDANNNTKQSDSSGSGEETDDGKSSTNKRSSSRLSSMFSSFVSKKSKKNNTDKFSAQLDALSKKMWERMIESNRLILAKENEMTEEHLRKRGRAPSRSVEEEDKEVRELAERMRKQREELKAKLLAKNAGNNVKKKKDRRSSADDDEDDDD